MPYITENSKNTGCDVANPQRRKTATEDVDDSDSKTVERWKWSVASPERIAPAAEAKFNKDTESVPVNGTGEHCMIDDQKLEH
ncbi:hypothetical protein Hte_009303 [Hypoxylon texense]